MYYPIETLVEVGLIHILIMTSPENTSAYVNALGDGSKFVMRFTYVTLFSSDEATQAFTISKSYWQKSQFVYYRRLHHNRG